MPWVQSGLVILKMPDDILFLAIPVQLKIPANVISIRIVGMNMTLFVTGFQSY